MRKISVKMKRHISSELKRFTPIIQNLKAKGTATSEDDSRIVLNDMLSDILGYDKYNELRTDQREKAGRLDYIVKLSEGPNINKRDKIDCVIEAKAIHQDLVEKYVDQTMTYCLTTNTIFFILTNVRHWRLYKMKPARKNSKPSTELIHEVDLTSVNNLESMAEDFYIFSRASYLAGDWYNVASIRKATNVNDIYTIILSDKVLRVISRTLSEDHGIRVPEEIVSDVVESKMGSPGKLEINRPLLKRLNMPATKVRATPRETGPECEEVETEGLERNCDTNQEAEE